MEGIFMWSEDIRVKIPGETSKFASVASQLRLLVGQLSKNKLTIEIASYGNLLSELQNADTELTAIEKVLNEYLEGKRKDFPRFYFISSADLLDILTCANAQDVFRHLPKLFDSVKTLEMRGVDALQMVSKEDECVTFQGAFKCSGAVEVWLNTLISEMRRTLRHVLGQAVAAYRDKPRHEWLHDWPAQPALCASQIWWAAKVERAFRWLEEGNENAMKNYQERQKKQLSELINMLIGELTMAERQKIMTICTIDVHSRDVVAKLIADRIDSVTAFQWQSQLRHRWDEDANDCFANICDAQFPYDHEYLGNTPRLVVTPLTDKCYITLTQSLHLFMGGAPAGPAGTGKTETTKDLGRALGMMVYVFNCSEQMDYKSCGNIYKGLAQTGAFGCFDEFNRISVEVLSVVAIQVKTILDALKTGRTTFNFFGETIKLVPTVGIFITMNPGYAGRTELPENLKALFRPCSMIVPDIELICEILLVAEGFQSARALARKFISLYSMCRELLSKQDHYDWGLRAVKSVLVVAGSLKRADPDRSEDEILMRALRDFNTPKITVDDTPVFLGLIGDLFPALDVPRQRNEDFEEIVKMATVDLSLQPEPGFVQKVTELEEILQIRHSVFIVGAAGVGKSCVWKTLFRTYERLGRDPVYDDLNPKAVTNDELFGVVNAGTREWQDGLFSIIMRDQAYASNVGPKWIVCDGDIDPMWIESLNTVMDDNKVLTLANNERIALTPSMRLLFEISHLRAATPATVSRAGIIYINSRDVGYQPLVVSWLERRESDAEKIILSHLFNKYVPMILEALHTRFTTIIPLVDVALVHTTCSLLDSLLTRENVPQNSPNEWYEMYFVFAAIWGFGGALFRDQQRDWRLEFHRWWVRTFKTIKFPSADATIFDYHIDPDTKKFTLWNCLRDEFRFYAEIPLQMTFVDTEDTARVQYLLRLLIHAGHPAMVVGGGGCGKTMVVQRQLSGLPSDYMSANIPVNLYTTSRGFQESLEMQLERTSARSLTPRNGRKLIYFVDDINLPQVDLYGTVAPHTLLRQFFDYRHWYERDKYILKNIQNCSVVATMNPNVGSFTINPRLQRHFATVALDFPSSAHLQFIYSSILRQHLENKANKFTQPVQNICTNVVKSIMDFHLEVSQIFLPTSTKFHYNFNLHDITNVFQGLIFSRHSTCPKKEDFFKLLIHELHRVYADKLVSREDLRIFDNLIATAVEKAKDYMDEDVKLPHPLLYFHYANSLNDSEYSAVDSWQHLNALLEEAQVNYREIVGASNLVLFEDAMAHVCRIIRILESTRGHAMLVGVGGSGKRSLTRLSAFISSLPVEQIQLSSDYGVAEFKGDLAVMYKKTGVKTTKSCLMMSDAQIPTEEFVMIINDILTTGECVNLLPPEDVDEIVQQVRSAAKQQGFGEDRSSCWRFFIDRVRNNLKIILCLSPVGGTLRQRARKFPGIFSNCRIIWFHDWPTEALVSVAERFLTAFDLMPHEYVRTVSNFLAKAHNSVNEVSTIYRETEKRFNYTTPKTFLDTIDLYRKLFRERKEKITQWINRLDQGLIKLDACTAQVDVLKETLAEQEATTTQKKDEADIVLQFLQKENAVVSLDRANVAEEEKNVRKIEANIAETTRQCEAEVKLAEPAINQAKEALNTLDKKNLTELKSFGTPPPGVEKVTEAVLILFAKGNIPKDRSWKACRAMMGKADTFLNQLKTFDKENIRKETISAILPYVENRDFKPEKMKAKSSAAAGLCAWVINIYKFYQVYSEVKPKLIALDSAKKQLAEEQAKLGELSGKLSVLEEKLSKLESKLQLALDEQKACQDEVDRTENALDLANRLIVGLASERVRWKKFIVKYREQMNTTLGDTLIGACFISYLGCFTQSYREKIITDYWLPALMTLEPSLLTGEDLVDLNPFLIVCDTAMVAEWNNEGLPSDRMSVDNAMILLSSVRWPLIIDPELQGLRWIRRRFGDDLVVTRLDAEDCLSVVEQVVRVGGILLLENVDETLNPMLSNLFGRVLTRGGQAVMLGDREIVYNPAFRLILQTKLSNPHYQPEVQAQLTLINFTVTREGLEDQLLVDVVKLERPELEEQQHQLTVQRNEFKIQLKDLEDKLLERLSGETGNILQNSSLVENVEDNKRLAEEIEIRSAEARETAKEITAARELYRDVAKRAAILYFVLKGMHWVNPIYQYSMELFRRVFVRAILDTQVEDTVRERVNALIENITYQVYEFVSRGMFKKDKSLLLVHIFLQLYVHSKEYNPIELGFLLRCPAKAGVKSPVPFLTNANWGGMCALAELETFRDIDKDIEESSKRWRLIVASEVAENEKFPGNWRNMNSVQKLCILRVIRPDRMVYACYQSAIDRLGPRFRSIPPPEMSKIFQESSSMIPIFFILSPGVDPIMEVEKLGHQLKFTADAGNYHIVSLGQGQEAIAEDAIARGATEGHWVILQNIHLVAKWLPILEKRIYEATREPHESFRLFLSAEPAEVAEYNILPQGILESAIKVTNEPPSGIRANLHGALNQFTQATLEMSPKEREFKAILFAMCYFHAIVGERRKFGPAGWNRQYPFNYGDLTFSSSVLKNYLEDDLRPVPWEDLRYMFGEIIYGGHITDDWDKRLCHAYLQVRFQKKDQQHYKEFLRPPLIDHELEFCPGFDAPDNLESYTHYHEYVDDNIPLESPYIYGLHPNVEIVVETSKANEMFDVLSRLQPQSVTSSSTEGASRQEVVRDIVDEFLDKCHSGFVLEELMARARNPTPYTIVALQECERMNVLWREIRKSLLELKMGLSGELTMSRDMDELENALFSGKIPEKWVKVSYPSLLSVHNWFSDLLHRVQVLEVWTSSFNLPAVFWLGGFFNPQSLLTAVMQQTSRRHGLALDRMSLNCEVTEHGKTEIGMAPHEGINIHGLHMDGAQWDVTARRIVEATFMELTDELPVVYLRAVLSEKQDRKDVYECPLYRNRSRGPTYIWTFNLKSNERPSLQKAPRGVTARHKWSNFTTDNPETANIAAQSRNYGRKKN
ncbi:dynein beta chain, ciliary-like [Phlebotomus argentipes]|uniref:dynein beta chain, ciliary-like n=1 Tax=Phlebotomus argentipes TaxID=94469 RepID=UPI002892F636|nr:dynein beta chain, ciliary-like [Phlebotomus argentipes]